ncbi:Uncharacterised protein [Escherichia coli]|uniref:Uncharacterized protein n=1 Tax=Escherichia coli TaxID=562 RepID=A0A2X1N9A8_ECOLX|nr:Uncharacterised protein [Escherichia coli]
MLVSQPQRECLFFESLSSTVQSAETIQESIGRALYAEINPKGKQKQRFQKIYNLLDNKLLSKI